MSETTKTLDRATLLDLCERGFSPQASWHDRDSSSAHRQLGECYALLKAGCDFSVAPAEKYGSHWVRIAYRGFASFEWGEGHEDSEEFYVPTAERLDRAAGRDWY